MEGLVGHGKSSPLGNPLGPLLEPRELVMSSGKVTQAPEGVSGPQACHCHCGTLTARSLWPSGCCSQDSLQLRSLPGGRPPGPPSGHPHSHAPPLSCPTRHRQPLPCALAAVSGHAVPAAPRGLRVRSGLEEAGPEWV